MVVMDRKKKLIKFLETRGIQASYTILRQLLFVLFLFRFYVTFNNLFIHIMTVSGYGRELNIVNAVNANVIIIIVVTWLHLSSAEHKSRVERKTGLSQMVVFPQT